MEKLASARVYGGTFYGGTMAKEYNAKDIQILEGLDAVRIRP